MTREKQKTEPAVLYFFLAGLGIHTEDITCAEAKKLFKKHCWENQTEWEKSLLIKVVWFEEISNI